jgi:hypothetical protein
MTGNNIIGLINYNEQKVGKGEARLIGGENMVLGKKAVDLSYGSKISTFEEILAQKKGYRLNKTTFHASLNFDPSEQPCDATMAAIARQYMQGMGYGNQPYLVYRHEDTHHPHMHIVSVKVDREGNKMDDRFYKRKSEEIRKTLEMEWGLVKASEKIKQNAAITPIEPAIAHYGKAETKAAISNVVRSVARDYKVSSLREFQAVLARYNVGAEPVAGTGKQNTQPGLLYFITDRGVRQGVAIKASSMYSKPILKNLIPLFEKNKALKKEAARHTAGKVNILLNAYSTLRHEDFKAKLAEKGIEVQYHEGKNGIYGLTFIDHVQKAVFKGSELGKDFSWNKLKSHLGNETTERPVREMQPAQAENANTFNSSREAPQVKKAYATLSGIYASFKKDPLQGAFFESCFIQKINQLDLATPLMKAMPPLSREKAELYASQFKHYKCTQLDKILEKERAYFKSHVYEMLRFTAKIPATTQADKLRLLQNRHIHFRQQGDKVKVYHDKGNHVAFELQASEINRYFKGPSSFSELLSTPKVSNLELNQQQTNTILPRSLHGTKEDFYEGSRKTLADIFGTHGYEPGVDSHHTRNRKKRKRPRL